MDRAQLVSAYLLKRGRGINYSFIKPWERRWVTLDVQTGEMIYYEDIMGSNRIEKGRLYLGASEVKTLKNEDVGKPFAFEIYFNDASKKKVGITLACKSMDELMQWVEAVQGAAQAPAVEFSGKGADAAGSFAAVQKAIAAPPADAAPAEVEGRASSPAPGGAYEMDDIDDDPYVPPETTSGRVSPVAPEPSSFADIDDDEPAAPAVIVPEPPPPPQDLRPSDDMNTIDEDSYSKPKDIDEDEVPPVERAAVHSNEKRIPPAAVLQMPSRDSFMSDAGSVSARGAVREYLSPSAKRGDSDADWWEPGGGENSGGASAARDFSENLQIKIKIRRLQHRYTRLDRRLHLTKITGGFSKSCKVEDLRGLLGQLYHGSRGEIDVARDDWTALFAAMFVLEEGEAPPPERAQLGDLNVILLAEVNPGRHRLEIAVRPWDTLRDIAVALSNSLHIAEAVAETALNKGMGQLSDGKKFSLYPKTVELLMEELCAAERSVLTHESMMLNMISGEGEMSSRMNAQNGPEPHLKHDFNTPYVPSFLGHVDDEFKRADEDGDGMISRAEWRKWIGEKERLVRVHNNEKAYLIKETRSLRKALSPVQQQAYEALMQSEAKREVAEMDLAERTKEHRKALSDLAKVKIRIAQLEATVSAYEENGAKISPSLSINKIHNIIASDMLGSSDSVAPSIETSVPESVSDNYPIANENNFVGYDAAPEPRSWIRNYISTDINYAAGKAPDLTTVPPSIAEVNRLKSGATLSEQGARDLKSTLSRLGRDTTLSVVTGVYPSSTNSPKNDLNHWDTLALQNSGSLRSKSPGRDHVLHQALRNAQPAPTEKMSMNSKGNVSVMHRIYEEREKQRRSGSHLAQSPDLAQSQHRRSLRRDYMAPTVTSSGKEKPGLTSPTTAVKGGSGWF